MKTLNEMNKAELRAECKAVGVKGYGNMDNAMMRNSIQLAQDCGHSNCPHCNQHLSNGYWSVDDLVRSNRDNGVSKAEIEKINAVTQKFWCMACDAYFGEERTPLNLAPKATKAPVETGIKIEKNREEQNGIKRPSIGGVCRAIWDHCDAKRAEGSVPKLKDVKAHATEQGWDLVTTSIQYYQWRKFCGIVGRI